MGVVVTNSLLKTFQRCQMQFIYKHQDMLSPNVPELPLKRGLWLHRLLEVHYTGGDWRQEHKLLARGFNRLFEEEREYYGNLPDECFRLMMGYLLKWTKEDNDMEILGAEVEVECKLPHGHTFKGKIDLITEDEYGVWVWEHKSHKTLPEGDYRFLDVQTKRYVYVARKALGINPAGILWNYLRTKPPTRPKLTAVTGQLSRRKIDTELYTFVTTLKSLGLNPDDHFDKIRQLRRSDNYYRRVRQPVLEQVVTQLVREAVVTADAIERGVQPVRSIDRSCEYACSYRDLCVSDLYGGNTQLLVKQKFHVREEGEYHGDVEFA